MKEESTEQEQQKDVSPLLTQAINQINQSSSPCLQKSIEQQKITIKIWSPLNQIFYQNKQLTQIY